MVKMIATTAIKTMQAVTAPRAACARKSVGVA